MTIAEKVAYLKGLAEGLNIDTEKSKEGKLITMMMDILQDVALELEDLQTEQANLGEEIDAVSDDLSDVEELLYDDEEEDDEEDAEEDEEEDCYASVCPNCGDEIYFDDSVLESGEVVCPGCGTKLNFDLSDLTEEETADNSESESGIVQPLPANKSVALHPRCNGLVFSGAAAMAFPAAQKKVLPFINGRTFLFSVSVIQEAAPPPGPAMHRSQPAAAYVREALSSSAPQRHHYSRHSAVHSAPLRVCQPHGGRPSHHALQSPQAPEKWQSRKRTNHTQLRLLPPMPSLSQNVRSACRRPPTGDGYQTSC